MNDTERSLLHSIFAVASCSCAAVFALGGIEVVPDGKLHLLCVQPVRLCDGMAAEVGIYIVMGQAGRQRLKAKIL